MSDAHKYPPAVDLPNPVFTMEAGVLYLDAAHVSLNGAIGTSSLTSVSNDTIKDMHLEILNLQAMMNTLQAKSMQGPMTDLRLKALETLVGVQEDTIATLLRDRDRMLRILESLEIDLGPELNNGPNDAQEADPSS